MNELVVADIKEVRHSKRWGSSRNDWSELYEPSVEIKFYCPQSGTTTIAIESQDGKELELRAIESVEGINVFDYNLKLSQRGVKNIKKLSTSPKNGGKSGQYLPKGVYVVKITNGRKSVKGVLKLK
jgi:hypothetical protein